LAQASDPWLLAVEALPGQFDQRADSAAQSIQLLTGEEKPLVRTARVYVLFGQLSDGERGQIRSWLINPVEAREAGMDKPESLDDDLPPPLPVGRVEGFAAMDDAALDALRRSAGLAMSLADLQLTRAWFSGEARDPSWTELRVLDTYWSDHCRHTTFLTRIEAVEFPDDDPLSGRLRQTWQDYLERRGALYGTEGAAKRPVCLMDLATLAMKLLRREGKLDDLDVSEEINACSIKVEIPVDGQPETWLIQFKNETHNHPTEIEPFGGAATCLGGAIRDPLSGRAYVYQAMRVTGSGDPRVPISETLPGRLPQRKITTTAAAGYSSYGNQVGLATGQVEEIYHPGYRAKRMEIGAVIGAVPADQVRREQPEPGDVVILLGGRTGRDGCGGATGSSKAHDEQSMITCGSEVQKGNPPTERKIQRLFRDPAVSTLIRRCNDFGAGGVSVAIGELADGLRINLDRVPRKYDGLDGTELAISESQERMAVVVSASDAEALINAADRENLEATIVAEVTAEPRMVMTWRGETIVDLSREFIDTNGASQSAAAIVRGPAQGDDWFSAVGKEQTKESFAASLKAGLSDLAACSRKGLVERFDSTIGAATVLMPFGGRHQLTPEEGMAARVPVEHGHTDATTLMTFGFDPLLSQWSPYHGAYFAVLESLVRLAALGGDPRKARLTFQEYFERLESDEQWGKPLSALLGGFQAQLDFSVPSIGGKDSMSGSFNDLHVPPTLVSFAVGLTTADQVVSAVLSEPDQPVWLLPVPLDAQHLPIADRYLAQLDQIARLRQQGLVAAQATVRRGGAAVSIARMCFGEQLGFVFAADSADRLFQPLIGSLLFALPAGSE
ncbi:MAG: phosphoribosylformylglycinamidine synthase, partial [Eubacteriales bacterium]|nr:phosphoribosylformylglycinamidine synthase [Eubacteriales bacterium]